MKYACWFENVNGIAKLILICLLLITTGCGQNEKFVSEYGKVSGNQGSVSVNGTSVLYEMFRQRGFKTKRSKKISPRIDRYGTIVWIPNSFTPPSQDAINALEEWLESGFDRTLIYVGRDFSADADYFEHLLSQENVPDREKLIRNLADAKIEQDLRIRRSFEDSENFACDWFEMEIQPRRKAESVSGPWVNRPRNTPAIEVSTVLRPNKDDLKSSYKKTTTLVDADGTEFAYAIHDIGLSFSDSPNSLIIR